MSGQSFSAGPIELNVLARREMAVALVVARAIKASLRICRDDKVP